MTTIKKRDSIPIKPGAGARWTGWVKKLGDVYDQLMADLKGLELRLQVAAAPGVPTCYRAEKVFEPERTSFALDTDQDGASSELVNYVLRDGQAYSIPVRMPGDGVFVLDFIKVHMRQRIYNPTFGPMWVPGGMSHVLTSSEGVVGTWLWTTKFSLFPLQPQVMTPQATKAACQPCAVNFFWNCLDGRSGRKLSDDWISNVMLLPGSPYYGETPPRLSDGPGFFRVDCPWLFERDGQLDFLFFPINPVLQFDSSIAGTDPAMGLAYDDREHGVRNQPVQVAVELHGYRFRTDQDAARAGALTRY